MVEESGWLVKIHTMYFVNPPLNRDCDEQYGKSVKFVSGPIIRSNRVATRSLFVPTFSVGEKAFLFI